MISKELEKRINLILEKYEVKETDEFTYDRVQAVYDALDGCDSMTENMLETSVLSWFSEFRNFLFEKCKNNPSTFDGKTHVNHERGIEMIKTPHCDKDDQGFEGGWTKDAEGNIVFERIVQDLIDEENLEVQT